MSKLNKILLGICVSLTLVLSSFGTGKKKKFLDFFTPLKSDSLIIGSREFEDVHKTDASWEMKGTAIDTSFGYIYSKEEADDLQWYVDYNGESSTFGYYKVKLDLGYYLVVIRAGGQFWNSRIYACLFHTGENKVTHTVLVSENFEDEGAVFTCNGVLRKKDKIWEIKVHEYFSEPVDEGDYKRGKDRSMEVRNTDILYQIENVDDRYVFVEKEKKDKTEVTK